MIVALTGASGTGKDTIFELLKKDNPNLKFVESITTREKRSSDRPGAYRYVDIKEFEKLKREDKFVWHVGEHNNSYGTLKESLQEAIESKEIFFMILVPKSVKLLFNISKGKIIPFYIISPGKKELIGRLKNRGDKDIEKRIADCLLWDKEAYLAATFGEIPYNFIANDFHPPEKLAIPNIKKILELKYKISI
ncbi:MAG: hypothetical protein Q7S73_00145 [bacterium]|nr:hypothetical protein [bacterium]